MKLSKQEFLRKLSKRTGLTQVECRKVFDAMGEVVREEIASGNEVTMFQGLVIGSKLIKGRTNWENPLIGGRQDIPDMLVPKARFSDWFKQQVKELT